MILTDVNAFRNAIAAFDDAAELAPWRARQPQQMAVGMPGKVGYLRLGFELRHGRSILADLYRVAPLLVQQALYWDEALPGMPYAMIISTGGGTLQGDRLGIDIKVGAGAMAHVTTQGATRIHEMDANYAAQSQSIVLEDGAYLEYLPDPTIPYKNARYLTRTHITIDPGATLLYGEIVMPGRKHHGTGERFAYDLLSMAINARRPDGTPVFAEKILVEPQRQPVGLAGIMAGYDTFANVLLLAPPTVAQAVRERCPAGRDAGRQLLFGASRLPRDAGLMYRVVGCETREVRRQVREFWRAVREVVTGAGLPVDLVSR